MYLAIFLHSPELRSETKKLFYVSNTLLRFTLESHIFGETSLMRIISVLSVLLLSLFVIGSCSKSGPTDPLPVTIPVITSPGTVNAVTATTAVSGGNITSDGGSTITARGVCWNTSATPTVTNFKTMDGSGTGVYTSTLTGLTQGTVYYLRAYATNSKGTSYAPEVSFTTSVTTALPTLANTTAPKTMTENSAISGGNILSDGGADVTSRGVCWSTSTNPTTANLKTIDGNGLGIFTSNLINLTANTIYYVRAYATNSIGTGYGTEISFTSSPSGAVTLCSQVWMNKNLTVSTYRNGDPIPLDTNNASWQTRTTGAYSYHKNDPASEAIYGKLYNWYAVNDPRGLAPTGWHVASSGEWSTLATCLGGSSVAGGALKEAGTTHWASPNVGATNISGFTALPGGWRSNVGNYSTPPGNVANWWTSTEASSTEAVGRTVNTIHASLFPSSYLKVGGFSVRCVKD